MHLLVQTQQVRNHVSRLVCWIKNVLGKYRGWEYGDEGHRTQNDEPRANDGGSLGCGLMQPIIHLSRHQPQNQVKLSFPIISISSPKTLRHEPVNADMWKLRWRWNSKSRLLKGIDCGGFDGFAPWFFSNYIIEVSQEVDPNVQKSKPKHLVLGLVHCVAHSQRMARTWHFHVRNNSRVENSSGFG